MRILYSPAEIERASMEIIQAELDRMGVSPPEPEARILKRVIHTSADFDYAHTLTFTPGAAEAGVEALRRGAAIITDTNMAKAGVSGAGLRKLGGQVLCFMADPAVAARAKEEGVTRASAAMDRAVREYPGAVLAVGNAPTALLTLCEHLLRGYRPALVIGVPVGFVNVVEAKERILSLCRERDIPAIVALGRKGGSTVAAAICNALLYTAGEMTDPSSRGW